MRQLSRDLKATGLFPNNDKKRCKTLFGKRKNSESCQRTEQVIIGKYKYFTDSMLGEGYSSKVYKGTEVDKPQKRYAVKVIELQKFQQDTLKMLEQEITIHLKLKHQNVVECFDAIKTKTNYFLILEFCPHGSLDDFIQRKKKIALPAACEVMDQVAAGFKYLVANKIVHRDIKPANILKHQNTWKIADFGFAVRNPISFTGIMNVGTPLYMPLESLVKNQYSFKSDIFAFGVTFYQMLHGDTPWPCRNEDELIEKLKKQPLLISSFISNEDIKTFLSKSCAVSYEDRMTHKEFEAVNFLNFATAASPNTFKDKIVFRALSPRKNSLQTNASLTSADSKKTQLKDSIREGSITENDLIAEMTVCKHIYSMITNIQSFLLDQQSKQSFWMTLFKFLVRLVHEAQKKSQTIKSTCNKTLYNEIKQSALRYEKEYLDYLKHLQVKVIREVNNKFPELCNKNPFSKEFYQKTQAYLISIMKDIDRQLMESLKTKKTQTKDKIQAFKALKKFYEYCFDNTLSENSSCNKKNIEVCTNFKATLKNNQTDYYNMRKVLINV